MKVLELKARLAEASDDAEVRIVDTDGVEYEVDGATLSDNHLHLNMGDEAEDEVDEETVDKTE